VKSLGYKKSGGGDIWGVFVGLLIVAIFSGVKKFRIGNIFLLNKL